MRSAYGVIPFSGEAYLRLKNMKTRSRRILFAKEHMYTLGAKMGELPVTLGTRKPVSRRLERIVYYGLWLQRKA
jgi:hypothetical protein